MTERELAEKYNTAKQSRSETYYMMHRETGALLDSWKLADGKLYVTDPSGAIWETHEESDYVLVARMRETTVTENFVVIG